MAWRVDRHIGCGWILKWRLSCHFCCCSNFTTTNYGYEINYCRHVNVCVNVELVFSAAFIHAECRAIGPYSLARASGAAEQAWLSLRSGRLHSSHVCAYSIQFFCSMPWLWLFTIVRLCVLMIVAGLRPARWATHRVWFYLKMAALLSLVLITLPHPSMVIKLFTAAM